MKKLGDQTIDERLWRSLFTFDESKPMPPAPKPSAPSGIPPNKPKLPTPNPVVTLPPTAIRPVVPSDPCACVRLSSMPRKRFQPPNRILTLSLFISNHRPTVSRMSPTFSMVVLLVLSALQRLHRIPKVRLFITHLIILVQKQRSNVI